MKIYLVKQSFEKSILKFEITKFYAINVYNYLTHQQIKTEKQKAYFAN